MNEGKVNDLAPTMLFRESVVLPVETMARGKIGISGHFCPKNLTIFELRNPGFVQAREQDTIGLRKCLQFRCEPTDSELFLQ